MFLDDGEEQEDVDIERDNGYPTNDEEIIEPPVVQGVMDTKNL